jgi:hypothetical protein
MRPSERIACVVIFALLGACQRQPSTYISADAVPKIDGLSNIKDASLRHAVNSYYLAESRHDWKETYGYRSAHFRAVVPFDTYANGMSDSFLGWGPENLSIRSSVCNKTDCALQIVFCERFDESLAKTKARAFPTGMECFHVPNTLWRRAGEKWEALDVGSRDHVPLNANMADN